MRNMFFSGDKARLVLAQPLGTIFQTRRLVNLPGEPGDWRFDGQASNSDAQFTCVLDRREFIAVRPRYPVGQVCYVGVPHWRLNTTSGPLIVQTAPPPDESVLRGLGYRLMAGRSLPARAARAWVVPIEIRVQRVGDITEADARAELVESHDFGGGLRWRDYLEDGQPFTLTLPSTSFFMMLIAAHRGKPVPRDAWCFAYTCKRVERPKEAPRG